MLPRTEKQLQVLNFIRTFAAKRGYSPSYGMIARHIGVRSRATAAKHVAALERRGLLKREGPANAFDLKVIANTIECPKCCHSFSVNMSFFHPEQED